MEAPTAGGVNVCKVWLLKGRLRIFRSRVPEEDEDEEVKANSSPPAIMAIHNTYTCTLLKRFISRIYKTLFLPQFVLLFR